MELSGLTQAIDELFEHEADLFVDGEGVAALYRQFSRLHALVAGAAAALDASKEWQAAGAGNCATYLALTARLPRAEARRDLSLGRRLGKLTCVRRAFSEGEISSAHASAIAGLSNQRTEKALERDEELLVEKAKDLDSFADFTRVISYWEQLADPEGTDERAEEQRARRDVFLAESFGGAFLGKMTLDPISGTIVRDELSRLENELFASDWTQATERLGRDPKVDELERTPAQRRADALVEMATRSKTAPADGKRPEPLFSIFVGWETLNGRISELANGTVVSPAALVDYLDGSIFERVVFGTDKRVEVSNKARLFTGATRRAIELRDRQCTHPYCDRPISQCQCDHIIRYADGGPTTQENGRLLCGFHNRLRDRDGPPGPG
jgi:hypothetical protein